MSSRPLHRFSSPIKRSSSQVESASLSYLYIELDADIPVLFLHGIPSSAELWREVMVTMHQDRFRVFAIDLPGYGKTRLTPDSNFSLKNAARLVALWIEQKLQGEPVWLVGHDLGGAVAQILAVEKPQLIQRLTLCNSPFDRSWPVLPVRVFRLAAKLSLYDFIARNGMLPNPYTRNKMKKAFFSADEISEEKIKRIFWSGKVHDKEGRRQFALHLRHLNNDDTHDIKIRLKNFDKPVQLIWADRDYYQPWLIVGRRLSKVFPHADVRIIANSGHYLPLENPQAVTESMLFWHDSL